MSSDNPTAQPQQHKPNSALTPEERQAKKRLKSLSKLQSKISKFEKSIAHAHRFAKTDVAEDNQKILIGLVNNSEYREIALSFVSEEFKYLFENGETSKAALSPESTMSLSEPQRIEMQAKAMITKISDELFRHMYTDKSGKKEPNDDKDEGKQDYVDHDAESRKRKRTEVRQKRLEALRAVKAEHHTKAKQMCRAMTKGEQKESMFDDAAALWGYTRQKYVERARLIYQSFLKLHPEATAPPETKLSSEEKLDLKARIWQALLSIEHVCSIGCGPGSDVAGVLALRKCICMESKTESISPSATLLDYVIDQWKETILDIVLPIAAKEGLADLERIACERTDVTHVSGNDAIIQKEQQGTTLYITSYLLSEQRDKWHNYYTSLAKNAKSGDIFYFCEPKPWQLHLLIRLTREWLDFLWVDSSMYYSELQPTDMRAGPAVLVAIKR